LVIEAPDGAFISSHSRQSILIFVGLKETSGCLEMISESGDTNGAFEGLRKTLGFKCVSGLAMDYKTIKVSDSIYKSSENVHF
jgi:hypothetical protein